MSSDQIVILMRLLAGHTNRTPGAVGRMASGRGDTYPRLARGHDIISRRATQIVQWLSDNWPSDLEWPADIARPLAQPGSPAARDAA